MLPTFSSVTSEENKKAPLKEPSGAANGTRTRDLLITNELLYRLSYTSIQHGKNIIVLSVIISIL